MPIYLDITVGSPEGLDCPEEKLLKHKILYDGIGIFACEAATVPAGIQYFMF